MKQYLSIALAFLLFSESIIAQPQGARPEPPGMKSPSEMAKEQTDRMQAELSLSKKQYKKVYKLLKKDYKYRQQARENAFPGGAPSQGGRPGGGPGGGMMGGGPGMGSGMPGGGMPPRQGGMQQGGRPEGGPGMGPDNDVITEEYLEKQDKKLRKILSPVQYDKWRAKHPAEHLSLPPLEMK